MVNELELKEVEIPETVDKYLVAHYDPEATIIEYKYFYIQITNTF